MAKSGKTGLNLLCWVLRWFPRLLVSFYFYLNIKRFVSCLNALKWLVQKKSAHLVLPCSDGSTPANATSFRSTLGVAYAVNKLSTERKNQNAETLCIQSPESKWLNLRPNLNVWKQAQVDLASKAVYSSKILTLRGGRLVNPGRRVKPAKSGIS